MNEVKEQRDRLRRNEEKWSETLMAAGWTALPSVILERQQALGLDALDLNILLQLARYWWYPDNLPHPSKRAIAECIGVNVSTVRKRIARLEADGLIARMSRYGKDGRQETNWYSFAGLIKEATPFAAEALQTRDERRLADAARRTQRGRPKLQLVTPASRGGKK